MNIVLELNEFNENNIFLNKPVPNTVIENSNFCRVTYSNHLFSLNGVNLKIFIETESKERFYNKYKCSFNVSKNQNIINELAQIETNILRRTNFKNKNPVFKIKKQLECGNIKLFSDLSETKMSNNYIIKLSGVWVTETEYGITYKFVDLVDH
tara:strand:- start:237 stop:695 length:459 start_codon:yes stop_codon:yes gene_type:complete